MRMRTPVLAAGVAVVLGGVGAVVATAGPALAATGCRVDYTVSATWPGGFGANVNVTNLGDPINGWTLVWSYAAGQTVTQAWSAAVTQSGSQVTARNAGYNGSLATNGGASFGFNGSHTGSNPVPTSFTLNGVACTGNASGPPSTPPSNPGTPGVPSDAVWVASGQWDTWQSNGYTVYNNIWGGGAGSQTIWARTPTNWGVIANHPMTSGVKSYPHTVRGSLNRTVSSLGSLTTSFNVSVPGSGNYATTYDIWANNWAYEVMVWMNYNGAVGPIAESYDANGAVPAFRNVSLGGHTFNIYRGNNGANAVFSFLRTSNTNSGTIDLRAILNWLRTNGWWADVTVGEVQLGFEISGTNGSSQFVCNTCSISSS
jgi:Cellulose binding domain/Glycosyl hydrolase family 12